MTDRLREAAQAVVDLWDSDGIEPGEGFYQEAMDRMTALAAALNAPAPALDVEALRAAVLALPPQVGAEAMRDAVLELLEDMGDG